MSLYQRVRHPATGRLREDVVRRVADGAFIPADPLNADWRAYLARLETETVPAGPSDRLWGTHPPVPMTSM